MKTYYIAVTPHYVKITTDKDCIPPDADGFSSTTSYQTMLERAVLASHNSDRPVDLSDLQDIPQDDEDRDASWEEVAQAL